MSEQNLNPEEQPVEIKGEEKVEAIENQPEALIADQAEEQKIPEKANLEDVKSPEENAEKDAKSEENLPKEEGKTENNEKTNKEEEKQETQLLDQTSNSKANRSIMKKASSKGKKHLVDELDLELSKHVSLNLLSNCVTPPAKFGAGSGKDFIKKNIQRSAAYLNSAKAGTPQDEAKINEILEENLKKGAKKVDVNERFYKKAENYKKNKEDLKEKIDKQELEACTFKPKTNSKDKMKQNPRDFNKKLDDYIEKKKKRQFDAITESKKQQEKQDCDEKNTYKPTICEKSKEILLKKTQNPPEGSIHERLYNKCKNQANKQIIELEKDKEKPENKEILPEVNKTLEENEVFFHPTINKKSQNLARVGKIENILYEDAIRRKNKPVNAPSSPQAKFLTSNSEKVLIEKFKREFNEALVEVESQDSASINYNQLLDIYRLLYFIREDKDEIDRPTVQQIWKIFGQEEEQTQVPKESILAASLSIMGFYEEWMETDPVVYKFSHEEVLKFHKKYKQLYKNRTAVTNKSTANPSFKNVVEPSFQPEMIAQSDELAEKWRTAHREPGKIEDTLLAEKAKKDKKLNQLKKKIEEEQLKECSFKPKTEELPNIYVKSTPDYSAFEGDGKSAHKGVILYGLAERSKEKKESQSKSSKVLKEEKEMQECTFKPSILEKNVGNINDFVQRMQNREEYKDKGLMSSPRDKVSGRSPRTKELRVKSPKGKEQNEEILAEPIENDLIPKPDCSNIDSPHMNSDEKLNPGLCSQEAITFSLSDSLSPSEEARIPDSESKLQLEEAKIPDSEAKPLPETGKIPDSEGKIELEAGTPSPDEVKS